MLQLWFGFGGRINRAKYWLVTLVNFIPLFIAFAAFFSGNTVAQWVFLLVLLLTSISGYSVAIRRLHDRDRAGGWVLLFYLAPAILLMVGPRAGSPVSLVFTLAGYVFAIWGLVELGCLRGTAGPNRYGEPLARG